MCESEDRPQRRGDAECPTYYDVFRFNGKHPGKGTEKNKDEYADPFKRTSGAAVDFGLAATNCAAPFPLKAERKERNPENVSSIKRTNLHGATRLLARKTKVVAKRHAFGAEMVDAVDQEHVVGDILSISPQIASDYYLAERAGQEIAHHKRKSADTEASASERNGYREDRQAIRWETGRNGAPQHLTITIMISRLSPDTR
jgi:hypothetical protein